MFIFNILFSKDEKDSFERKIDQIKSSENKYIFELLRDGAFGGRFSTYLSTKRFANHFGIADNSILIEKIHIPNNPRDVILAHNYKTLIEKYKRYFVKQISQPDSDNKITLLTYEFFIKKAS